MISFDIFMLVPWFSSDGGPVCFHGWDYPLAPLNYSNRGVAVGDCGGYEPRQSTPGITLERPI